MSLGNLLRNDQQNCIKSVLCDARDGQLSSIASIVPLWEAWVLQHSGRVHNPSLFPGVQCPDKASTLYLPETILAWEVAFSTSQGEEPQDVNMRWHLVIPRYRLFRYLREVRELTLDLRTASQYCRTPALAAFLT